jgi:hypothetical protein
MKDNNHISKTDFIKFQQNVLNQTDKESFLEHISSCDYCSDQFAAFMSEELITAPRDMKEHILKASKRLDTQIVKKANEASKRVQLLIYSLKVGTATIGALLLLLLSMNFKDFNAAPKMPNEALAKITVSDENNKTLVDKIRDNMDNISNSMLDFSNNIMKTEVADYDKEEK